jgi:hypothetical protein
VNLRSWVKQSVVLAAIGATSACVTRPPTIAHVHIGHALTGVHVTPGHKGYLLVAEQRADEVLAAAQAASRLHTLTEIQGQIAIAVRANDSEQDFGVKQSLMMAANHIAFAATSPDASENVIAFAPIFKADTAPVIARCDYIDLLGSDVAHSKSAEEAAILVQEMVRAARDNVEGGEPAGAGVRGAVPADFGMVQLRAQLQAMIAREHPAYRTVDEWYLFNLVRLPNGRWVFDKLSRGGSIDGYK